MGTKKKKRRSTTPGTPRKTSRTRSRPSKLTSARKRKTSDLPVYLGLGSNLGNRFAHLRFAIREIGELGPVVRVSPFFETEPVGHADQRLFLNAVVEIRTAISPDALLAEAKRLERRAGRTRTFRNGPRTLDVDLLDVRREVRSTGNLTLPHPRMHRRRFVLEPLAAIAPHWRHPVLGKTANQMLRDLDRDSPSGRDEIAPTRARRGEERARPRRR